MFKIFALSISTFFAVLMFNASAGAQLTIPGEVIDVIDGKTVLVALPSGKVKVELQYIDVPERGQELHDTIREHLRGLVVGKVVEYRPKMLSTDRAIGRLTVKNVDVSQQMLRDGAAWHLPSQMSGQEKTEYDIYSSLEAAAKGEKIGVWSIPGLKPAWEIRTAKASAKQERVVFSPRSGDAARESTKPRAKPASNPKFGDVGALVNRYDPESKTGLLSTSLLSVETDKSHPDIERVAFDITYYYKENDGKSRNGSFVVTAVFWSKKAQFTGNNNLVIFDGEKSTIVGRPRRTVSNQGDSVRETMVCEISRNMLEKVAINEGQMLKFGNHLIYLVGTRYLLYNLLQVTQ